MFETLAIAKNVINWFHGWTSSTGIYRRSHLTRWQVLEEVDVQEVNIDFEEQLDLDFKKQFTGAVKSAKRSSLSEALKRKNLTIQLWWF